MSKKNKDTKETWSKIRCALFFIALYASWIIPCFMKYQEDYGTPMTEEVIENTEDIIRWKQEEPTEITIEEVEVESVAESEEVKFYNVPLSEELQLHIFEECEKHNIAPAIIISMIEHESNYDANDTSTHGAKGLMQVVPKWHRERMKRLGCMDLYDPYQNVTVGIDYVAELKNKNPDIYWVLMVYNGGEAYATRKINAEDYSTYAVGVVERASELESENSDD